MQNFIPVWVFLHNPCIGWALESRKSAGEKKCVQRIMFIERSKLTANYVRWKL